ncbi:hypothetical protein G7K_5801-t1 [Saitoella complicata NRRL Y-17804]|uniref:Uncharacterized protein n=1 Tax=Saitoella complicata (strain BCRC 22490 / CBS 7301 / JCM 7358 / NBRC 10748 / NRRL Y-17804) TaxID=698492 RepID=A0A0E9NPH9_SAICN|nr:hypothetical protein G7K_5801-t1 [Saitoella complicata NRRL Y-17804]
MISSVIHLPELHATLLGCVAHLKFRRGCRPCAAPHPHFRAQRQSAPEDDTGPESYEAISDKTGLKIDERHRRPS